jgi:SAM-dependent methyltransferase
VPCAGGPGCYTLWLAGLGYQVVYRDLIPRHVDLVRAATVDLPQVQPGVADARKLDLDDESADAVLLLGPLYHLERRPDRLLALGEARRVLRPGGPAFVAAISRWATRIDGILRARIYDPYPASEAVIPAAERTGRLPPLFPGSFCCFTRRPGQFRAEVAASGLTVIDLAGVEGPAFLLGDLAERLADERHRRVVFDTARAVERVPELLGLGPHLLATAFCPARQEPRYHPCDRTTQSSARSRPALSSRERSRRPGRSRQPSRGNR